MCMRLRCDHALAVIRIMLGLIFIAHGSQKVFGLFGGPGLAGFATWLGTYGLPPVLAYLAAFAEFIGGALLVTGYFAKLGKREEYLKDERSFKKFLFDWAKETAELYSDSTVIAQSQWEDILTQLLVYYNQLESTAHKFKLSYDNCVKLINFMRATSWQELKEADVLLHELRAYFKDLTVEIKHTEPTEQSVGRTFMAFKLLNDEWDVNVDFFASVEAKSLLNLTQELSVLEHAWVLKIKEKDKETEGKGIYELIGAITRMSRPFMTVQRYKGLGEMNPEQLWETAMDATRRSLIQVSIGDALEADAWFDTLMGDDVQGRREFIEENGRFVKNLDV